MADTLSELVSNLSSEEQAAVREFIEFIRRGKERQGQTPFSAAVERFIAAHPELLRQLAE